MLRGALALVAVMVCAAPALSEASTGTGVTPPALQSLEQKMLSLQLTSERFSASESLVGSFAPAGPLGGLGLDVAHAATSVPLLSLTGEASFIPQEASFQSSVLGLPISGRLIGSTLYVDEPFIAKFDGHRPWVQESNQNLEEVTGVELGTLGGGAGSGAEQAFGKLIEQLNNATSIQELGPMTIDDQATTAFSASLELDKVASLTSKQKRVLLKDLEPVGRLEVFIAEDGLPVRTSLALTLRPKKGQHGELIEQSDVLAINVPVVVQAPPAAETITQAQLKLLLARTRHIAKVRNKGTGKSK